MALGLLAEMAESAGQHNTIAASMAIVAGKMNIGSWQWACWPRCLRAPGSVTPSSTSLAAALAEG